MGKPLKWLTPYGVAFGVVCSAVGLVGFGFMLRDAVVPTASSAPAPIVYIVQQPSASPYQRPATQPPVPNAPSQLPSAVMAQISTLEPTCESKMLWTSEDQRAPRPYPAYAVDLGKPIPIPVAQPQRPCVEVADIFFATDPAKTCMLVVGTSSFAIRPPSSAPSARAYGSLWQLSLSDAQNYKNAWLQRADIQSGGCKIVDPEGLLGQSVAAAR